MKKLILLFVLTLTIVAAPLASKADESAVEQKLASTEMGKHALAYFQSYKSGTESDLRAFYKEHLAKSNYARRPEEQRLEMHNQIKTSVGQLSLQDVVAAGDSSLSVSARAENGDALLYIFAFEGQPPYGILSIGIERGDHLEAPLPSFPAMSQAEALALVQKLLDSLTAADAFSGTVLIARNFEPVYKKAFGLADREFNVPNKVDTKFNLGSINKKFTQTAIGRLLQEGKLSLDDNIGKFLPDYPNAPAREQVTIDHLLNMSGGIGDFFGDPYRFTAKDQFRDNGDFVKLFAEEPLHFPPGSQDEYSNGGYILLGEIIKAVTGMSYYDYVRKVIFEPAGMTNTDSYEADHIIPNRARGYTKRSDTEEDNADWRDNFYTRPAKGSSAGGGYSTAEDLLKFGKAVAEGKILDPRHATWLISGYLPSGNDGITFPLTAGGFGIAGGAPGINSHYALDLGSGWAIIVMSNLDPPSAEMTGRHLGRIIESIK